MPMPDLSRLWVVVGHLMILAIIWTVVYYGLIPEFKQSGRMYLIVVLVLAFAAVLGLLLSAKSMGLF